MIPLQPPRQLRAILHFAPFTLALMTLAPASLDAQQPAAGDRVTISGAVVAEGTSAEIPGAAILLSDRAAPVVADRRGRFTLPDVRPGRHSVIVTQLGYDTLWAELEIGPDPAPLTLRLEPDPVVLERVTATVDRMARRRNAIGTSVRVFDRVALQTSPARSVIEHIQRGSILRLTRCPGFVALSPCARVRGRATEVQVYVDGARVVGGLDLLASYPPDEIYTAEVIGGGRVIRVYTTWFMETIAEGRRIPDGFLF